MTYEEMLKHVVVGAGLEKDEADRATRAFFQMLSRRIGNDEARQFATQLPVELQDTLAPTDGDVETFAVDEFVSRFSEDAGLEPARAEHAVHAIWRTLRETVDDGQLDDVRSQLPNEFVELFEGSGAA